MHVFHLWSADDHTCLPICLFHLGNWQRHTLEETLCIPAATSVLWRAYADIPVIEPGTTVSQANPSELDSNLDTTPFHQSDDSGSEPASRTVLSQLLVVSFVPQHYFVARLDRLVVQNLALHRVASGLLHISVSPGLSSSVVQGRVSAVQVHSRTCRRCSFRGSGSDRDQQAPRSILRTTPPGTTRQRLLNSPLRQLSRRRLKAAKGFSSVVPIS